MRIGVFHNRYKIRGGEDRVFDLDVDLLRRAGHEVFGLVVDNRDEIGDSRMAALRAGLGAAWSRRMARRATAFVASIASKWPTCITSTLSSHHPSTVQFGPGVFQLFKRCTTTA